MKDMVQQQRQEILSLTSYFASNFTKNRVELVVKGAGNNAMEAQRAVEWMNDVLQWPNWTMENISRIRDLVNQKLSEARKTMQGREEAWVRDPADAYMAQDMPLYLATSSFLTAAHNIHRLRWMLMDGGNEKERKEAAAFLDEMAKMNADREALKTLLAGMLGNDSGAANPLSKPLIDAYGRLSAAAKKTAGEAAKDLEQVISELPDASLAADWNYLCRQMKKDLLQTPEVTLRALNNTRRILLSAGNARLFVIGSGGTQAALQKNIHALIAGLSRNKPDQVRYAATKHIVERVKQRLGNSGNPVYVGLINPNSPTGVFINAAPLGYLFGHFA
jgi:hypothetical protein